MSYARLIVNPAAGAGKTARKWPEIESFLKSIGLRFDHDLTEAPGHACELATAAVSQGYDFVVSVGGDGTIHEVVNGLYDSGGIGDVVLGIISTGTGGDFVRTVGTPRRYTEACQRLLSPRKITLDLGLAEYHRDGQPVRRLFVNFAGLGFDAEVARMTGQRFKFLGDMPAYLLGLLATFLSYRNCHVTISYDGQEEERKLCSVMISNGRYGGGSMLIAPHADLSDGLLDVVIIDDLSKPDLLWSLPRIYRGTHLTHPKVEVKRTSGIEIRAQRRMSVQADGELLGETPARFSVLPAALTIGV